jgi:hypothetical protein
MTIATVRPRTDDRGFRRAGFSTPKPESCEMDTRTNQDKIREIATECLKRSDNSWTAAASAMREVLNTDLVMYRALMEPLVNAAVWAAIKSVAHANGIPYAVVPRPDTAADIIALSAVNRAEHERAKR